MTSLMAEAIRSTVDQDEQYSNARVRSRGLNAQVCFAGIACGQRWHRRRPR